MASRRTEGGKHDSAHLCTNQQHYPTIPIFPKGAVDWTPLLLPEAKHQESFAL